MASVPDTSTFGLQDVVDVVVPSSNTLQTCFDESADDGFDSLYKESKNKLSNFRNYGNEYIHITEFGGLTIYRGNDCYFPNPVYFKYYTGAGAPTSWV